MQPKLCTKEAVENEDTDEKKKVLGGKPLRLKPMNCEEGLADPDKVSQQVLGQRS